MKRIRKILSRRATLVFFAIAAQLVVLIGVLNIFADSFYIVYAVSIVLSVGVVIWILNDSSNPAYKLAWIIPILVFPIFGGLFYVFFGKTRLNRTMKERMVESAGSIMIPADRSEGNIRELEALDPDAALQARYLSANAGSPLWANTATEYLPTGELAFQRIVEALKKAEKYIFLEFFIIAPARCGIRF